MKKKKMLTYPLALGETALVSGVMANAVTKSGGDASGMATFGAWLRPMGTIGGAGMTLSMLNGMVKAKPKKKKIKYYG